MWEETHVLKVVGSIPANNREQNRLGFSKQKMFLDRPSRSLFHLFSSFQTNITIFTTNVKNVHPVFGAWNRTHDLLDMSLLP